MMNADISVDGGIHGHLFRNFNSPRDYQIPQIMRVNWDEVYSNKQR